MGLPHDGGGEEAAASLRKVDGLASIGPPHDGGGEDSHPVMTSAVLVPLQWGRRTMAAETGGAGP